MGYYTSYDLSINCNQDMAREIIEQFRVTNEDANYALLSSGDCQEPTKWYDHEKHLRELSLRYLGHVFTLECEGEEMPDLWREYYKDGKMHRCKAKITYDEFNEGLLV